MNKKFITQLYKDIDLQYYKNLDNGHDSRHLKEVVLNAVNICNKLDIIGREKALIIIAAIYHDTGLTVGRKEHHFHSKNIVLRDVKLQSILSSKELFLVADACKCHRASEDYDHKTRMSRVLADADNLSTIDRSIERCFNYTIYNYGYDDSTYDRVYKHLVEKFGDNGYAKFVLPECDSLSIVKESKDVLRDESKFKEYYKIVHDRIRQ